MMVLTVGLSSRGLLHGRLSKRPQDVSQSLRLDVSIRLPSHSLMERSLVGLPRSSCCRPRRQCIFLVNQGCIIFDASPR
jgi:hypothetical protein